MRDQLKKGERLFVVPDLLVDEPVPWDQIPAVIRQVHQHVVRTLAPENPCGECRQCCVTLYIAQDEKNWTRPSKPSHVACGWCDHEAGCLVHFNRPKACRKFECLWLKSQRTNRIWPEELRPDRCHVIFTGPEPGDPEDLVYAHPDAHNPEGFGSELVRHHIEKVQEDGFLVRLVTHYRGEA